MVIRRYMFDRQRMAYVLYSTQFNTISMGTSTAPIDAFETTAECNCRGHWKSNPASLPYF